MKCFEHASRVMAEDIVALFSESEGFIDQFPISSQLFIENITQESLLKMAMTGKEFGINIPKGYSILSLLPKKIPDEKKKELFKVIVKELCNIRKDFSQRRSMEVLEIPAMPEAYRENITEKRYRELLFTLEVINERRVPLFRGWGFDAFAWRGSFFRVYNLGTIKKPMIVIMGGKLLNNPSADVFGHMIRPEKVKKPWLQLPEKNMIDHVTEEELREEPSKDLEERIDYAIRKLSKYLHVRIQREKERSVPNVPVLLKNKERVIRSTEEYILSLLEDH